MPAPDITDFTELFFKTASDHVREIEKLLDYIESSPTPTKIIDEIFRHVHSLKGSSSVMGYTQIAEACEKLDVIIHPEKGSFVYTKEASEEISSLIAKIKNDLGNALHDTQL